MFGRAKSGSSAGVCPERESAPWRGIAGWFHGCERRNFLAAFLVFAGYFLGARLGFALTFQPHPVSVMWPPNSVLLGILLLTSPRRWPFLLLAAFPAHLASEWESGVPLPMILCWFISNASEALIGAALVRWLIGPSAHFERMRSIGALFLCGALVAPFLSSFIDSAFVTLNHFGNQPYWNVWRMRFFSNVFTATIFLPVIVCWGSRPVASRLKVNLPALMEPGALFLSLLIVSGFVFCFQENGPTTIPLLLYAPLPFLLWAALRFGPTGTSATIFCVALFAIWGAVHGRGPFAAHLPEQNALSIQAFFVVISTALTFLAAAIAEGKRAEERFTKAFRSSPDAMIITHLDGRVVEVNERWEKIYGYPRNEMIGRATSELSVYLSNNDRERLVKGTSAGRSLHNLELSLRTKGGEFRQTLISAEAAEIGGDDCLIIIIRDITDRKRGEEAQQNLAHASRLAVVGELTAMVAHEINQPLAAILCNAEAAEMLLESKELPLQEIREILSDIRKNDLRADDAIKRIRGLLRKRAMQVQPIDLNEAVTDVLRLVIGDAARRHVVITRELAQNLPLALGDRVYLQQVLLNLIVNAMEAMMDVSETDRRVSVQTKANETEIELLVADSGRGFRQDDLPNLFESFFTTKPEGMGLGLSIARSIIESHQGRIWAENNSNGGATFHFTIPAVGPQNAT
jgi:two-component system sensor kinase FixL